MKSSDTHERRPRKWTEELEKFSDSDGDWGEKVKLSIVLDFLDHKIPVGRPLTEAGLLSLFKSHLSLMAYVPEEKRERIAHE